MAVSVSLTLLVEVCRAMRPPQKKEMWEDQFQIWLTVLQKIPEGSSQTMENTNTPLNDSKYSKALSYYIRGDRG